MGRYEIVGVLGSGAMGTVYLGCLRGPTGFSRLVAIKRPHPHLASDPDRLAMLLDEARITARIRHANVAQTLDVLQEPDGTAIVMEYVEGVSLIALFNHLAKNEQPIPIDIAVTVVCGALTGLHAAHEATSESGEPLHIVHRDVSGANLLIGVDGVVRLLDFGVAKTRDRLQPTTEKGGVKGTYAYMAPEQFRNQPFDRRADVYAAAVLLWQCIAGRRLWLSNDPRAIVSAALFDSPPSLHALRPEVTPELDALIQRGLAKHPDERFATALEMARALEERVKLVSSATLAAWLKRVAPDLVAAAAPPAQRTLERAPRVAPPLAEYGQGELTRDAAGTESQPRATRFRIPVVIGVLVVASAVAGVLLSGRSSTKTEAGDTLPTLERAGSPPESMMPPAPVLAVADASSLGSLGPGSSAVAEPTGATKPPSSPRSPKAPRGGTEPWVAFDGAAAVYAPVAPIASSTDDGGALPLHRQSRAIPDTRH